jgi:ring-1,2-phenylacetyl-CoA epoxidase subunit PaaD
MVTQGDILGALRTIDDPEMPINIVDLGLVEKIDLQAASKDGGVSVNIEILPTFVGCMALPVIENEIRCRVGALPGVTAVEVHIVYSPPWSVDRINPAGRESLRRHGVSVPGTGEVSPSCPFCGSAAVRQESAFGPTRCRMIWYCESCRQPFEHLKRLATGGLVNLSLGRLTKVGESGQG